MTDTEQHQTAQTLGAQISREQSTHWSVDKRIPIFSVGALAFGGLLSIGGALVVVGSMKQTFADEIEKVAAHETRIISLENSLVQSNLAIAELRGDIREVLVILRQQAGPDRMPPQPH